MCNIKFHKYVVRSIETNVDKRARKINNSGKRDWTLIFRWLQMGPS